MGAVYTATEIRDNLVPELSDFPNLEQYFAQILDPRRCAIPARGIVCGSVGNGKPTRRSDFDLVMIYDWAHDSEVADIHRALYELARASDIRLNLRSLPRHIACRTTNGISESFGRHINGMIAAGRVIGTNDPNLGLFTTHNSPYSDTRSYVARKRVKFTELLGAKFPDQFSQYRHFQKVAELAIHVARKQLAVWGFESDLRSDVITSFRVELEDRKYTELLRTFSLLVENDEDYSALLDRTLSSEKFDLEAYTENVESAFEDAHLVALDFLDDMLGVLDLNA